MSRHSVTLPSGQTVTVRAPARIAFNPPIEPAYARALLATEIARRVEPHILRRPGIKSVVRDKHDRIIGLVDADADPPVREQAWRVGTEIAEFLIPLGDEAKP